MGNVVESGSLESRVKAAANTARHIPQGRELPDPQAFIDKVKAAC